MTSGTPRKELCRVDAAGPARDTELMPRGLIALVVLVSVLGAAEAGLARPAKWPPPHCPTARALVAYYVSDGFTFNDDLVVRRDGHASLCWGRHIGNRSGRRDFALPLATMTALARQLTQLGALGAPPPPPTQADVRAASLVYRGKAIPGDGYPKTDAGVRALHAAERLLDRIIARHAPA